MMQLFEGDTLDVFITKNGCLTEDQAWFWFTKLVDTLSVVHSQKIAHRDIKPQNLMIDKNLDLMLIDFNISKKGKVIHHDEEDEKCKYKFRYRFFTQVSTPLYAAPELVNNFLYTEAIDIWGVGMILCLMLFGESPFRTRNEEIKEYTVEQHQKFINNINTECQSSQEWKDLILKLLAFDWNDRLDCQECLQHKWVTQRVANDVENTDIMGGD